jgi:UDP-glucose:(heptosyl)LPS alpha-1,3-glucosyltransferase
LPEIQVIIHYHQILYISGYKVRANEWLKRLADGTLIYMTCEPNKVLAFCLYKYFPHGGLQRDMLRIAEACQSRGFSIHIYTTSWQGRAPEGFEIYTMRPTAFTNHGRMRQYHAWLMREIESQGGACVIGFNKMPDLDFYYTADCCYQAKALDQRGRLYRLLPRYRQYRAFEEGVFGKHAKTHILMLSRIQESLYKQVYGTSEDRIHFLPPNLDQECFTGFGPEDRRAFRQGLGLKHEERLLVQVGSGFRTKGLDRSIRALAGLPPALRARTRFLVVGRDNKRPYVRLARRLGVAEHVVFYGPSDDVPRILFGADLMIHPAYNECAGNILVEALAAGLPVVVSAVCGYAHYIQDARAGWVLSEPFDQEQFNDIVHQALERPHLQDLRQNALDFVRRENLSGKIELAADIIETVTREKAR